jgi:hypothetical protein
MKMIVTTHTCLINVSKKPKDLVTFSVHGMVFIVMMVVLLAKCILIEGLQEFQMPKHHHLKIRTTNLAKEWLDTDRVYLKMNKY